MKLHFFAIPALDVATSEAQLNAFLAGHRVAAVEKHFVANGNAGFWSVCVTSVEGAKPAPAPGRREKSPDYREILSEADFALYARLRTRRKELAERDGVPVYAVFTNEQLAEMVTSRAVTLESIGRIAGVGEARLGKYGAAVLEVLTAEPASGGDDAPAPAP